MKFLTILFLLFSSFTFSQTFDFVIFDSTKTYVYSAIFLTSNGDTLSNEKIILKPTGELRYLLEIQTICLVEYFPIDSISIVSPYPMNNKTEYIENKEVWVIENSERVLMHPFQDNQYVYTDIAPIAEIKFRELMVGAKWINETKLISYSPKFKYLINSEYEVISQLSFILGDTVLQNCWVISAKSHHKKWGYSFLESVFYPEYGFIEMNYSFKDGTKIFFKMIEVIKS